MSSSPQFVLRSKIPDCVTIGKTKLALEGEGGLFVTKNFKKGEVIYEMPYHVANYDEITPFYTLEVEDSAGNISTFNFDKEGHIGGPLGDGKVILWGFRSFTNHHCSETTILQERDDVNRTYKIIANKDFEAGDEILMNYNMFIYDYYEYDANCLPMECKCGLDNCLGSIKGFKYLDEDLKRKYIKYTIPSFENYPDFVEFKKKILSESN